MKLGKKKSSRESPSGMIVEGDKTTFLGKLFSIHRSKRDGTMDQNFHALKCLNLHAITLLKETVVRQKMKTTLVFAPDGLRLLRYPDEFEFGYYRLEDLLYIGRDISSQDYVVGITIRVGKEYETIVFQTDKASKTKARFVVKTLVEYCEKFRQCHIELPKLEQEFETVSLSLTGDEYDEEWLAKDGKTPDNGEEAEDEGSDEVDAPSGPMPDLLDMGAALPPALGPQGNGADALMLQPSSSSSATAVESLMSLTPLPKACPVGGGASASMALFDLEQAFSSPAHAPGSQEGASLSDSSSWAQELSSLSLNVTSTPVPKPRRSTLMSSNNSSTLPPVPPRQGRTECCSPISQASSASFNLLGAEAPSQNKSESLCSAELLEKIQTLSLPTDKLSAIMNILGVSSENGQSSAPEPSAEQPAREEEEDEESCLGAVGGAPASRGASRPQPPPRPAKMPVGNPQGLDDFLAQQRASFLEPVPAPPRPPRSRPIANFFEDPVQLLSDPAADPFGSLVQGGPPPIVPVHSASDPAPPLGDLLLETAAPKDTHTHQDAPAEEEEEEENIYGNVGQYQHGVQEVLRAMQAHQGTIPHMSPAAASSMS